MNDDRGWSLDQLRQLLREELRGPQAPQRGELTFAKLWELRAPAMSRTVAYCMVPVLAHFGARKVGELRRADWYHYRDEVRAKQITMFGKPPTVGTLNQERKHVLALLRWGVEHEHIEVNPFDGVKALKGERPRETEIDPFELEDAAAEARPLVITFLVTCSETGGRNASEVRRLEWSDIDYRRRMIRIPWSHTKARETREVPLTRHLEAVLRAHPAVLGSPYVFANPATRIPYSAQHMWYLCRPILNKLKPAPGERRVTLHAARHGFVSRLQRLGVPLLLAMKIAGHRSAQMHWRYTHVSDGDRDAARAALDGQRKRPQQGEKPAWDTTERPQSKSGSSSATHSGRKP